MSALAGGLTVVVDQPNTVPPISNPQVLNDRVCEAWKNSFCNFAINCSVTKETRLEEMWEAGAMAFGETFFAPSSYGAGISDADLSRSLQRIHTLNGLATIHAERISDVPDIDLVSHNAARSPENEHLAVTAFEKLNTWGCRIHFCHLSTKRSIDAASATVEVTPHHLFLSLEDFELTDPFGTVLENINLKARIALCGLIATYNAQAPVPGPYNFRNILMKRARVEGFIVGDYADRWAEAFAELSRWLAAGRIRYHVQLLDGGIERAPAALNVLFEGGNIGKLLLRVADEPV